MSKKLMYFVSFVLVLSLTSGQGVLAGQTFAVTNTNDSGTGSLRQAILDANANLGLDVIAFNIPARGAANPARVRAPFSRQPPCLTSPTR